MSGTEQASAAISREVVPYLQAAHALFNGLLFLAFLAQGLTGWRNRRKRIAGTPMDAAAVRRHRRLGPILALLLPAGYLAGVATAVVDHAHWLHYPLHFAVGSLLLVAVAAAVISARRIRGAASPWRARHAAAGLATLMLFAAQVLLGLGILL